MLTISGLRFESERDIEINVSRYSADMLTKGMMSCGEQRPEKYRLTNGKFDMRFRIQPIK